MIQFWTKLSDFEGIIMLFVILITTLKICNLFSIEKFNLWQKLDWGGRLFMIVAVMLCILKITEYFSGITIYLWHYDNNGHIRFF